MIDGAKTYQESFSGYFAGIIPWEKFDALWDKLKEEPEGWYVFQPDTTDQPPKNPMSRQAFLDYLQMVDDFLHEQQYADYCGCVYVNSTQDPLFIKVFHPRKMGSGCAIGGGEHVAILPWWTISKVKPAIMRPEEEKPDEKKGFLSSFIKG